MRLVLSLLLMFSPDVGVAETYLSDAFGLFPASETSERAHWSGAQGKTIIAPDRADRVLIVLGPKSLVAGKDRGHAVILAFDRFGNGVADATRSVLRIDGAQVTLETRDGISDHVFLPAPQSRQIAAGATIGNRQSPRAMIRVVPDLGSLAPHVKELPSGLASERFFEMSSHPLLDRFGNVAEDGTAASVILGHEGGAFSVGTAVASQGTARSRFLSRDIVGETRARMVLGSNTSPETRFDINHPTALRAPDLAVEALPSIGAVRLTVGPFLTEAGHTLADGAATTLGIDGPGGARHTVQGWIRDGYVTAVVPLDAAHIGPVLVISALGEMLLLPSEQTGGFREVME